MDWYGWNNPNICCCSSRNYLVLEQFMELKYLIMIGYWCNFQGNGLLLLAPGAFIVLGLLIWIQRTL